MATYGSGNAINLAGAQASAAQISSDAATGNVSLGTTPGNLTGLRDVLIGSNAGLNSTTGNDGVVIGYQAGQAGAIGNSVYIGSKAAASAGPGSSGNSVVIGSNAGANSGVIYSSVLIGRSIASLCQSVYQSTLLGDSMVINNPGGCNLVTAVGTGIQIGAPASRVATVSNNSYVGGSDSVAIGTGIKIDDNTSFSTVIGSSNQCFGSDNLIIGKSNYAGIACNGNIIIGDNTSVPDGAVNVTAIAVPSGTSMTTDTLQLGEFLSWDKIAKTLTVQNPTDPSAAIHMSPENLSFFSGQLSIDASNQAINVNASTTFAGASTSIYHPVFPNGLPSGLASLSASTVTGDVLSGGSISCSGGLTTVSIVSTSMTLKDGAQTWNITLNDATSSLNIASSTGIIATLTAPGVLTTATSVCSPAFTLKDATQAWTLALNDTYETFNIASSSGYVATLTTAGLLTTSAGFSTNGAVYLQTWGIGVDGNDDLVFQQAGGSPILSASPAGTVTVPGSITIAGVTNASAVSAQSLSLSSAAHVWTVAPDPASYSLNFSAPSGDTVASIDTSGCLTAHSFAAASASVTALILKDAVQTWTVSLDDVHSTLDVFSSAGAVASLTTTGLLTTSAGLSTPGTLTASGVSLVSGSQSWTIAIDGASSAMGFQSAAGASLMSLSISGTLTLPALIVTGATNATSLSLTSATHTWTMAPDPSSYNLNFDAPSGMTVASIDTTGGFTANSLSAASVSAGSLIVKDAAQTWGISLDDTNITFNVVSSSGAVATVTTAGLLSTTMGFSTVGAFYLQSWTISVDSTTSDLTFQSGSGTMTVPGLTIIGDTHASSVSVESLSLSSATAMHTWTVSPDPVSCSLNFDVPSGGGTVASIDTSGGLTAQSLSATSASIGSLTMKDAVQTWSVSLDDVHCTFAIVSSIGSVATLTTAGMLTTSSGVSTPGTLTASAVSLGSGSGSWTIDVDGATNDLNFQSVAGPPLMSLTTAGTLTLPGISASSVSATSLYLSASADIWSVSPDTYSLNFGAPSGGTVASIDTSGGLTAHSLSAASVSVSALTVKDDVQTWTVSLDDALKTFNVSTGSAGGSAATLTTVGLLSTPAGFSTPGAVSLTSTSHTWTIAVDATSPSYDLTFGSNQGSVSVPALKSIGTVSCSTLDVSGNITGGSTSVADFTCTSLSTGSGAVGCGPLTAKSLITETSLAWTDATQTWVASMDDTASTLNFSSTGGTTVFSNNFAMPVPVSLCTYNDVLIPSVGMIVSATGSYFDTDAGSTYVPIVALSTSTTFGIGAIQSIEGVSTSRSFQVGNIAFLRAKVATDSRVYVASTGFGPILVTNEGGDIATGDLLTVSASVPGYATKQTDPTKYSIARATSAVSFGTMTTSQITGCLYKF